MKTTNRSYLTANGFLVKKVKRCQDQTGGLMIKGLSRENEKISFRIVLLQMYAKLLAHNTAIIGYHITRDEGYPFIEYDMQTEVYEICEIFRFFHYDKEAEFIKRLEKEDAADMDKKNCDNFQSMRAMESEARVSIPR